MCLTFDNYQLRLQGEGIFLFSQIFSNLLVSNVVRFDSP